MVSKDFQPYYVNSLVVLGKASHLLSPTTMLVYLYLSGNQNGYRLALSCAEVCNWTGISKTTYHKAVKELIDKHFLCPKEGVDNTFDFYLLPDNNLSVALENKPADDTNPVIECDTPYIASQYSPISQCDTPCTGTRYSPIVECDTPCTGTRYTVYQNTIHRVPECDIPSTAFYDRNNLYNLSNNTDNNPSDNPIDNLINNPSDDLIENTVSQEDSLTTSSQAKIISVAKKEEIDVGDCKYSFVDLVNAMRLIYRYDYDGAVERVKATFEPDQRHEEKWKALNFTSPEGLERAVERGRVKFADEAQPP